MTEFSPLTAIIGGTLIGIAAATLMAVNGKIAGVSGMVASVLERRDGLLSVPVLFLAGLVGGGLMYSQLFPATQSEVSLVYARSELSLVISGVLIGMGTYIGSGCTSGHGVCGIARFSPRSIVATAVFMLSAMLTVWLIY